MTPQTALRILDSVSALAPINRIDQQNTQIATSILAAYIDAHENQGQSLASALAETAPAEPIEGETEAED